MNNDTINIKYRFPIFKQEKWKLHKLSEIAKYTNGRAHEQDIDANGKYVVINSKYISTDGAVVKYSNTAHCLAEKNDILMVLSDVPNGRAIAKCYLVKENSKYTVNQRICRITPNQGIESSLLYYLMNRNPYFLSFDDGVKQTNLKNDDVLNFEILLPSNQAEQQKIAACLSSSDDVIAGHEEKVTALEEHKKGLMQNLFPQEGETQPKYRFPEFENDGDWVEKSIIDTADKNIKWSFTGGPFGSNLKSSDYTSNGIRIIQLQNIGDGIFNDDYKIYTSLKKTNELLSCNIYSGDIILSKMGDPVGRACIMPGENQRFLMASDGIRLVVNEKEFSKYFIYSHLNSVLTRSKIEAKSTGSTRKRIGLDALKQIPILVPKSIQEQKKIAEVLSLVDELIIAQREKIEILKEHKKGLMQGLFPKIEI
ncbi:restriction endonuclease subunit S [Chryseobacterium sp. Chry.R1]|uniref:restriction endonuclease subunit S n=1 Tax=unclassified Chryseobacterium TaxID=2593645 RepID=UPI000E7149AF|nr:restriction endonuclease subunit S [Chryseobacterium sp. AG363]RKE77187.1 type I restriction enzyme S subunit [Chryseobacterium sp. AG363]